MALRSDLSYEPRTQRRTPANQMYQTCTLNSRRIASQTRPNNDLPSPMYQTSTPPSTRTGLAFISHFPSIRRFILTSPSLPPTTTTMPTISFTLSVTLNTVPSPAPTPPKSLRSKETGTSLRTLIRSLTNTDTFRYLEARVRYSVRCWKLC